MKDAIERHWTSYFYSGSIALIVSWALLLTVSGCRFGNRVDTGPLTDIGATGYYSTRPTSYTASTTQTTGGGHQITLSVASIPSLVSSYFTDPTALVLLDANSGKYAVFPPTNGNPSSYQSIFLAANGKGFDVSQQTGWAIAWEDPACQINTTYTIMGTVNSLGPNDVTSMATSLGRLNLNGRLSFKATYETFFQGNCSASWRAMRDCYETLASCPGSTPADQDKNQETAQATYKYWIQVGALIPSEIGTTSDLRFDVTYQ